MRKAIALIGIVTGLLLGQMWITSDAHAQASVTFHSGATGTADGTVLDASLFNTVGVQVSGTFVGTVSFEGRMEDASTWGPIRCINTADGSVISATTTTGIMHCPNPGVHDFRARVSSYTSGTIIVHGLGTTKAASAGLSSVGTGGSGVSTAIASSDTLPATCTVGQVYLDTDGATNQRLHICTATDTWTAVLDSEVQGLTAVLAIDRTYGGAVSQETAPRFGASGTERYWLPFDDPTAGLIFTCEVNGVLDDCHKGTKLLNGKFYRIKNQSDVVVWEVDHTGALTEGSINGETAGVGVTLYQPLCGGDLVGVDPAAGTAVHIWDKSPLDTAPTATAVTGTNQTYGVARFPDSDGDHGVQLTCLLPPGFTGQLDAVAWGKTTGTGNFRLQIATKCYASDEANDAAFNTASVFTMAAGTSGRLNRYALSNITITGCAADELLMVRAFRNRTEGSDTLNNTFDLKSLRLWARNTY